mmetsp:Transcript_17577/g.27162  ORF Transcript_17577/g.27162 Transcript_17577/m.27162 type:complete len:80 (-) Transcript_17577:119-358(-)
MAFLIPETVTPKILVPKQFDVHDAQVSIPDFQGSPHICRSESSREDERIKKILIVDDQNFNLDALEAILGCKCGVNIGN